MTVKQLHMAAALRPCNAEVLIYMDRPAEIHWVDDQPAALTNGYFSAAAVEQDGEALVLIAGKKEG